MSSVTIAPPKSLESPISVPQKTMMGPGPSNAADRVLKATALPVVGHLHPEFLKVMDDVKAGVQYAFQVPDTGTHKRTYRIRSKVHSELGLHIIVPTAYTSTIFK